MDKATEERRAAVKMATKDINRLLKVLRGCVAQDSISGFDMVHIASTINSVADTMQAHIIATVGRQLAAYDSERETATA